MPHMLDLCIYAPFVLDGVRMCVGWACRCDRAFVHAGSGGAGFWRCICLSGGWDGDCEEGGDVAYS